MTELTDSEKQTREGLAKSAQNLANALAQRANAAGGLDMMGIHVTQTLLAIQLEVLITMLFEAEPSSREDFMKRTTAAFDNNASAHTQSLILTPDTPQRRPS